MSNQAPTRIDEAFAALREGKPERAERILQRLLRKTPKDFDALFLFGALCGQQGRLADAATLFERATKVRPDNADAHYNLGLALARLGSRDRPLECYRAAIAANPFHAAAHNNLGAELLAQERWEDALACLQQALTFHPDNPQLHSNLGVALKELGRADEAISSLQKAVAAQPRDPAAHANLGLALRQTGRLNEAVASFRTALALDARVADYHNQLGLTLAETGELDLAIASLRTAIRLSPDHMEFRGNLGMVLLLRGDLREGWAEYRFRSGLSPNQADRPPIDAPVWQGEPLAGKRILVHAEQGLGDTLQFVRYLPLLVEMDAAVTFEVQPTLLPILACLPEAITVMPKYEASTPFDYQSPLLHLPHALVTELPTIPSRVPYLSADRDRVAHWRGVLGSDGFKIGICWQGSPSYEGDRHRSIALREFGVFAAIPGVRLISLQKGFGTAQIADVEFGRHIETLGNGVDQSGAFLDTAAVMESLDLVVTSDTSIAHLAGALGRPLFLALCRVPDWRWLMQREDSPWYPTARLFRQSRDGDWADVFARMAAAVQGMVERR